MNGELEYAGPAEGFGDIARRAEQLGVELRVVDRQSARGVGDIVLVLVAATLGEGLKQLVAEYATVLRERSRDRGKRRERAG